MSEQPTPVTSEQSQPVGERLKALIDERTAKGIATYGTPLMSHNGRDAERDALEESVDLNQHLMQKLVEVENDRNHLIRAIQEAICTDGQPSDQGDISLFDLRTIADGHAEHAGLNQ